VIYIKLSPNCTKTTHADYHRWTLNLPQLTARILLVIEKHSSHAQLLYHCFRLVRDLAKGTLDFISEMLSAYSYLMPEDPSVVPLVVEKIEILMSKLKDSNFHIEALQATGLELMAQLCNNGTVFKLSSKCMLTVW
jgi:hypothetical protein